MQQMDLLKQLMNRNSNAFMEMTDKYSWPVYNAIRSRVSDSQQANKLFNKTMDEFYRGMYESKAEEPLEALLLMYTEKVLQEDQKSAGTIVYHENKTPSLRKAEKGGFFRGLVNFLLFAAIVAVLWMIVGLLMDMNLIPAYDLGYAWFNTNIVQWF